MTNKQPKQPGIQLNMTNHHTAEEYIRKQIKELIAEITEREPAEISDTASFSEELRIDSLMALEVMVAVDKNYKIEISEKEFGTIKNVNDAVKLVQHHLVSSR